MPSPDPHTTTKPKDAQGPISGPSKKNAAKSVPATKGATSAKPTPKVGILDKNSTAIDVFANEDIESARVNRRQNQIFYQSILIAILAFIFVFIQPMCEPIYQYFALIPESKPLALVPLPMPNMTNHAVVSWAASSITEVMTIGFGDFDQKLLAQKWRFTQDGWDAFVRAFLSIKAGESFKHNQLVLTTIPADTAVILSQGENDRHLYQWVVQMPVVMTYATNNNVTDREKGIVTLTIVRSYESPTGIAIESWQL